MPNTTPGTRSHSTIGVEEVVRAAITCFGNQESAVEWLGSPKRLFAGLTPLQHACTHEGAQDVIELIHRLDHGMIG